MNPIEKLIYQEIEELSEKLMDTSGVDYEDFRYKAELLLQIGTLQDIIEKYNKL